MKTYAVKEIYRTIQGEGAQVGRTCIMCRFAGCNGWSGLKKDRARGPFGCSAWCDTDFVGTDGQNGGRYDAVALAQRCAGLWTTDYRPRFLVLTGGEPMLQVDRWLIDVFHRWEFQVAIETNGTIAVPDSLDWITVSPKAGSKLVQTIGQELKLVYPQDGAEPQQFNGLDFRHFFLQPMDGPNRGENTELTIAYCMTHTQWRLSLQAHKFAGIP